MIVRTRKKRKGSESEESATSRNLTRTLLALLFLSMGAWALLASLIAWHSHNRYTYSQVDLQDQRDIYTEFKQESKQQYEFLRRELRDAEILREQASILIQQMVIKEKRPEKLPDLLDQFAKIHGQLTRESLDQQDIAYMEDVLRQLIAVQDEREKKVQPGRPQPQPASAVHFTSLLNALAAEGYISKEEVSEATRQLQKILATANNSLNKSKPTKKPPPPKNNPQIAVDPAPKAVIFRHDKMRFQVSFPLDWTIKGQEIENGLIAFSPRSKPSVNDPGTATMIAVELRNEQGVEEYFSNEFIKLAESTRDFELLIKGDMQIDNKPAKFAKYRHNRIGRNYQSLKIITINGKMMYDLTFSAPNSVYEARHERTFAEIALSFKFL